MKIFWKAWGTLGVFVALLDILSGGYYIFNLEFIKALFCFVISGAVFVVSLSLLFED